MLTGSGVVHAPPNCLELAAFHIVRTRTQCCLISFYSKFDETSEALCEHNDHRRSFPISSSPTARLTVCWALSLCPPQIRKTTTFVRPAYSLKPKAMKLHISLQQWASVLLLLATLFVASKYSASQPTPSLSSAAKQVLQTSLCRELMCHIHQGESNLFCADALQIYIGLAHTLCCNNGSWENMYCCHVH